MLSRLQAMPFQSTLTSPLAYQSQHSTETHSLLQGQKGIPLQPLKVRQRVLPEVLCPDYLSSI